MKRTLVVDLPPIDVPTLDTIGDPARKSFAKIDSIYRRLPRDTKAILRIIEDNEEALRASWNCHELSAHYMAASRPRTYRPSTTAAERQVASIAAAAVGPLSDLTITTLKTAIRLTVAALDAGQLRRGFVHSSVDLRGASVRYPPPGSLPRLLGPLRALFAHSAQSPSFAAVATYVVVSSAHPLTDGNGRLSRIAFNSLMNGHFPLAPYLPLYEIVELSQGSHILCCREAHYHGDWAPIAALFEKVVFDLVESLR